MPYYLTKHVLTRGILLIEGEINAIGNLKYQLPSDKHYYFAKRHHYFENEADAKAKAERTLNAKIAWHKSQLKKLKEMTF